MQECDKEKMMEWFYEVTKEDRAMQSNHLYDIKKQLVGLNGDGRLYKYLKTDVGAIIGLIIFITSILAPYFIVKQDIALINQKLDGALEEHKEFYEVDKTLSELIGRMDGRISKIEGMLSMLGLDKAVKK